MGSSPGTAYIESALGIEAGGRTGLTAAVAAILFLPFLFLSPLLAAVPAQGIIWGFLSWTILKLFTGKLKEIGLPLLIIDALAIIALLSDGVR